jgi:hypothetical protein
LFALGISALAVIPAKAGIQFLLLVFKHQLPLACGERVTFSSTAKKK